MLSYSNIKSDAFYWMTLSTVSPNSCDQVRGKIQIPEKLWNLKPQEDDLKAYFIIIMSVAVGDEMQHQTIHSLLQVQLNIRQEEVIQHVKGASPPAWPNLLKYYHK